MPSAFINKSDKPAMLRVWTALAACLLLGVSLAQENIENEYRVDPALFSPRPHYLLRVEGMSMRDAGILDMDLLAVHRTPEARKGQIVVARVEDEVTVKRFHRRGHLVTLLPENPDFEPIEVDLHRQDFAIEGLGVGVIRNVLQ